jgi:hypothetical protein
MGLLGFRVGGLQLAVERGGRVRLRWMGRMGLMFCSPLPANGELVEPIS